MEHAHEFPMHHTDVMQQWIDYKASPEKYDELLPTGRLRRAQWNRRRRNHRWVSDDPATLPLARSRFSVTMHHRVPPGVPSIGFRVS